jgi:hypothetical protein
MRLKIFAVRDRATVQFSTPMFLVSEGQAIRSFTDEVNRNEKDSQLYAHPDDFDLYWMGDFDSDTGIFETRVPEQTVTGKQVKIRS